MLEEILITSATCFIITLVGISFGFGFLIIQEGFF